MRAAEAGLVVALLAAALQRVPTPAWALPPTPAPPVPAVPSVQHVTKAPTHFAPPKDTSTPLRATATAWPAAATADVALAGPAGGSRQTQTVRAGALPVTVQPVVAADGTFGAPRQLQVQVHDCAAAAAAGVNGLLLSVTPRQDGYGQVKVGLDYASFGAGLRRQLRQPAEAAGYGIAREFAVGGITTRSY